MQEDQIFSVLTKVSVESSKWGYVVAREKMIFDALNKSDYDIKRSNVTSIEGWVPVESLPMVPPPRPPQPLPRCPPPPHHNSSNACAPESLFTRPPPPPPSPFLQRMCTYAHMSTRTGTRVSRTLTVEHCSLTLGFGAYAMPFSFLSSLPPPTRNYACIGAYTRRCRRR